MIPRFKCIVLLIGVSLIGTEGRNFMRALCISFLVFGPIVNIASNGNEIIRVFGCSAELTYNLTKTRLELMAKPFEEVLTHSKDNIKYVADQFRFVKSIIEPIIDEVENDEDGKSQNGTINQKYRAKLEKRCRTELTRAAIRCRQAFKETVDKCMDVIPIIINHLLCWPLRIDFICDFKILDPDDACVPDENIIDSKFESSYIKLKNIVNETSVENEKGMNMEYKVVMPKLSNKYVFFLYYLQIFLIQEI